MISSQGKAAEEHAELFGKYTSVRNIVTHAYCPVFKHEKEDMYLYSDDRGDWCVGDIVGDSRDGDGRTVVMTFLLPPSRQSHGRIVIMNGAKMSPLESYRKNV